MPPPRQRSPKAISARAGAPDADALPLAVLEFQSPTAAIIATPMPLSARYTNWSVSALVLSVIAVSAIMPVDRLVTSTGVLTSAAPDSSIQAFNATSIVKSINVQPGELVAKGQVLATLDPTYAAADLSALTAQAQNYAAEVAQLRAQESGRPYLPDPNNPASPLQLQTYQQMEGQYKFTMQDYAQKISALQTNIDGYNAQAAYYSQRLGIAANVEAMRKDLQALQVGSRLDTLAATDDRVNLQAELASATSSAQSSERDLNSQQAERDAFDQQWRASVSQQLLSAQNNLAQTQQQLSKAQLNEQLIELTAPQDSIVQSVAQAAPGSVLQAGQQLMDLSPINAPLSVEADIDATESGYVAVGDTVKIKFQTLPSLEFGSADGIVRAISPESFNPLDQTGAVTNGAPLPGAPRNLYYKARISLDVINLHNTPAGFQLVPGMPVEADMKVGTRTVMGYFLQRMMPVAYNSLHEP